MNKHIRQISFIAVFMVFFIFLFAPLAQAAPTCVTPPAGMVSWWTGDQTPNDFLGVNNGSLQNGATYTAGMVGDAFSFNDSTIEYVSVPNSSSLSVGTGDFSMDAWIKTSSTKDIGTIEDKRGAGYVGYHFYLASGGFGPAVQFSDGTKLVNQGAMIFLADGQFHHVAVSVRRNVTDGIRLFVDGNLVLTSDPTTVVGSIDSTVPLLIGGHSFDSWRTFAGLIDEFDFFNRALTDNEVKAIYLAGSAGKCKGSPFAAFTPRASVKLGPKSEDDTFKVSAKFALAAKNNGIDPVAEDVTIKFGSFSTTIPAGKFQQQGLGVFTYKGKINKVYLKVEIHEPKGSSGVSAEWFKPTDYSMNLHAKGAKLDGTVLPPEVKLTIGDDTGSAKLDVGKGWFGKGKDGKHWLSDDDEDHR